MKESSEFICVSENDIGPVHWLVVSVLKTYSGVTWDAESARIYLEYVRRFAHELHRANVVPPSLLPAEVIALNSNVSISDIDSGGKQMLTLVLPNDAGRRAECISVMSPIGMALFGYSSGDQIEWGPLQRRTRLTIDSVTHMNHQCPSSRESVHSATQKT